MFVLGCIWHILNIKWKRSLSLYTLLFLLPRIMGCGLSIFFVEFCMVYFDDQEMNAKACWMLLVLSWETGGIIKILYGSIDDAWSISCYNFLQSHCCFAVLDKPETSFYCNIETVVLLYTIGPFIVDMVLVNL